MDCPSCKYPDMRVTDSRSDVNVTRRRRECMKCGLRVTTEEHLKKHVKRTGKRESSARVQR